MAIAAVLRQAALAIGEPDRAAQVERVACEARAGDLAYLSVTTATTATTTPGSTRRVRTRSSGSRPSSPRSRSLHVVHVSKTRTSTPWRTSRARAAIAFGAVGDRGAAARAFLAKGGGPLPPAPPGWRDARLAAVDAARARPGERQDDPDLEAPEHVAAYLRPSGAGAIVARRGDAGVSQRHERRPARRRRVPACRVLPRRRRRVPRHRGAALPPQARGGAAAARCGPRRRSSAFPTTRRWPPRNGSCAGPARSPRPIGRARASR